MKLIIDIPEKVVTAIQNGEDYRYDIHTTIAQGIPYDGRPQGDLISRSALKEEISSACYNCASRDEDEYNCKYHCPIYDFLKHIDNAPAVNPYLPISEEVFYKITDAEFELSDSFWITTPSGKKIEFEKKRPQGEWVEEGDNQPYSKDKLYGCSKCGFGSYLLSDTKNVNFCPNCGTRMKGGAE